MDIKQNVVSSYSEIAIGHRRSCGCSTDENWTETSGKPADACCAPAHAKPEADTGELNLGCGAPLEFADLSPGQTVLDLGSGSGREVFLAARAVGETGHALGLDMTPAMIGLARSNAEALGVRNVSFILGDIENMPLEAGSVDRVISNCVLNLTTDKEKAFAEVHRVMRDGGRFAISDIVSTKPLPESIRSDPKLWCDCVGGALPIDDYLAAARKAGFLEVTVVSKRSDSTCGGPDLGLLSITVTGRK